MKTRIKKRLKIWKVGESRTRKTNGGYSFYCSCGNYKTLKKGDKIKVTKGVSGYIHKYRCPKTGVWTVLEYM